MREAALKHDVKTHELQGAVVLQQKRVEALDWLEERRKRLFALSARVDRWMEVAGPAGSETKTLEAKIGEHIGGMSHTQWIASFDKVV
jgi:hypothetical protein